MKTVRFELPATTSFAWTANAAGPASGRPRAAEPGCHSELNCRRATTYATTHPTVALYARARVRDDAVGRIGGGRSG